MPRFRSTASERPADSGRPSPIADEERLRRLGRLVTGVAATATGLGGIQATMGLLYGEPRIVLLGGLGVAFGLWLGRQGAPVERMERPAVVARVAGLSLGLIAASSILDPTQAPAMAIAALLPCVLVVPFLGSRQIARILALGGAVGLGSVVFGGAIPASDRMPDELSRAVAVVTLVLAYGFLLIFLWEVSRRLKRTADDLRSVVAMASDLARTMDPQLVGDRIARHIALAVGANDCALSYWDQPGDRLVTLGYYPPERRDVLEASYPLADYPATRDVLDRGRPTIIDVADPAADRAEVAYLRSIAQASMTIVPLIAAGTTIGTLELTCARSGAFDGRHVELATMLAGEAAMAFENARLYDEISRQALHDGLTGLANRVLFRNRVEHALARTADRDGRPFAIMFIDLDDFKTLNDTLGHARGDDVLVAVGERVRDSLRPSDTAARLGGDEFAVLLEDVPDEATALSIAIRLADALREPIQLGDAAPSVAASIGVALSGGAATSVDDLLRNADVAMYAAKASSRGRAEVFRSALRTGVPSRSEMATQLRGVEARGELRLDYQPIVELDGGRVVGLEALVRWQRPGRPLLMPTDFIDLAEETGDIVPLGRWVIREACRQVREWQVRLELPDLQASVNLSARQFREHDLLDTIRAILAETDLAPSCLALEITESGLMQRTPGTVGRLAALRELGVHLAIDDFGTGYSSLSYLERFPVDILKIDRSFIAGASATGERIARAVVELGRALGLRVIAEGVESPEQAAWLAGLGCPLGQGYLFSRPLGGDAIEAYLAAEATRRASTAAGGEPAERAGRTAAPKLRLVSGR